MGNVFHCEKVEICSALKVAFILFWCPGLHCEKVEICSALKVAFILFWCPGLGWDRVNFHKKPGGLDNQMGCMMSCDIMLGI